MKSFVGRIKANKITLCIIIICFILIGMILNRIITDEFNGEHEYQYNVLVQGSGRTPSITAGEVVSQKFICHKNNMHQIGIFALMPGITTDSNVNVKIVDIKDNQEIFNQDIFLGAIKDSEYFEIFLENQPNSKNKEYEIIITGIDGNELNSIQLPYTSYPNDFLRECKVNNEVQEYDLVMKMTFTNFISIRLQLFVVVFLFLCVFTYVIIFSTDDELIYKNLNLNKKEVLLNLKNNWYWIISIISCYLLFVRTTKIERYFIILIVFIDIFILSQVKSIKEKIKTINNKIKIYSLLSTIGICAYEGKILFNTFLKYIEDNSFQSFMKAFPIIIAILASFIIFALMTIFLDYIISKIKTVFDDINKKEKIFYIIFLGIVIICNSILFLNSTAFYGTEDSKFDVLFTSDSGRLVIDENVYLSIYHGENDLRQPLFAVFASPFVGATYTISLVFNNNSITAVCMNLIQIILYFVANLMISKLLKLNSKERIAFIVLSFCTYMSLLFTVMMEQYLIAYFYLITFIYLACMQKQDEISLSLAGGTLLTSLGLTPFIVNEVSVKKVKEIGLSFLKARNCIYFITCYF